MNKNYPNHCRGTKKCINQKHQREIMRQGGQEKTFGILDEDEKDYGGTCI